MLCLVCKIGSIKDKKSGFVQNPLVNIAEPEVSSSTRTKKKKKGVSQLIYQRECMEDCHVRKHVIIMDKPSSSFGIFVEKKQGILDFNE